MGTKRVGLARMEALMENLKREIQLNQAVLVGQKVSVKSVGNATTTLTVKPPFLRIGGFFYVKLFTSITI
jgi:hypothetical protein